MLNLFKPFNRSEQRVLLFLIASALIATAILIVTHVQREKALSNIKIVHSAFEIYSEEIIPKKVNLSTASLEELISLPKIDTTTAYRIIEYRQIHGGFKSIEEIIKVKGIGAKTFEKIKDKIEVSSNLYSKKTIQKKVNLNTASLKELTSLPKIGTATAKRIIEYRQTHGKFQSIEDITKVKGIGPKTFEKIKGMIEEIAENGRVREWENKRHEKVNREVDFAEEMIPAKVNLNTASLEELETLPGIGPVIAKRIIEYRETQGRFQSIEDITKMKGIGQKTVEKIKEMITVDEVSED